VIKPNRADNPKYIPTSEMVPTNILRKIDNLLRLSLSILIHLFSIQMKIGNNINAQTTSALFADSSREGQFAYNAGINVMIKTMTP